MVRSGGRKGNGKGGRVAVRQQLFLNRKADWGLNLQYMLPFLPVSRLRDGQDRRQYGMPAIKFTLSAAVLVLCAVLQCPFVLVDTQGTDEWLLLKIQ